MTSSAEAIGKLKHVGFAQKDVDKALCGEVVRFAMEMLTERELAVAFAVVIQKTTDELETMFLENLGKEESDEMLQQLVNQNDDDDGSLDFSLVKFLPPSSEKDMVAAYVDPKSGGANELNLSADEWVSFRALDKKTATVSQVEEILRTVLAKRLELYRQKGLEGIPPYQRKGGKSFDSGKELLERCQKLTIIRKIAPEIVQYMQDYPNSKPTTGVVKESFSWMNYNIDEKPTFCLVHKVTWKRPDIVILFHRHFYVSRGHNSVQAVGGGQPLDDDATLVCFSCRTSTDQVAGFGGSAKRALGSRIMGEKLANNLSSLKKSIEKE